MRTFPTLALAGGLCVIVGCSRQPSAQPTDSGTRVARASVGDVRPPVAGPSRADAAVVASVTAVRFAPRWSCRTTGPGRFGPRPQVSVPAPRPGAPEGTVADAITLRDGARLAREPVMENGRPVLTRGTMAHTPARTGAARERTYVIPPGAQEMFYEDATSAGAAFLLPGGRIVLLPIGETSERTLVEQAGELGRPCVGTVNDPLRLTPIAAVPWEFPQVAGIIPLVADARWTLSRDAQGLCVARLEGEGPWGRAFVEPRNNSMRGDLSLAESLNPIECGPAEQMAARDAGTR